MEIKGSVALTIIEVCRMDKSTKSQITFDTCTSLFVYIVWKNRNNNIDTIDTFVAANLKEMPVWK